MSRLRSPSRPSASESLFVLADLQEFGIPGQQMPLPSAAALASLADAATWSPPASSSRRLSDTSMVLPSMDEETYLDFTPGTTPVTPVRPPPPSLPLPSPPQQRLELPDPRRAGSLGTLSALPARSSEHLPLKSLPIPRPRRMESMDSVSSSRSRHGARSAPSPPPDYGVAPDSRPFSVMSQSTEQDLLAIAEMLSPAVDVSTMEMEPIPEGPSEELDSFDDMFADEITASRAIRDSFGTVPSDYSQRSSHRDSRTSNLSVSVYSDSDGGSYMGDEFPDPALLSPPSHRGNRGFQLHRGSLIPPPLDDSRSLSSSTSYSSLRTPSLSRTSSLAYLASPPVSPTSPHAPSDTAGPSSPSVSNPNAKLLGIIEESLHAEEAGGEHYHSRNTSEATETFILEDYLNDEETPQRQEFPSRSAHAYANHDEERQPSRSESRQGAMRSPSGSHHKGEPYSPLWSPAMSRSESRTDSYRTASRSPQPARRPPALHLQISGPAASPASAPPAELAATSPFGAQPFRPQRRSTQALPPQPRLPLAAQLGQASPVVDERRDSAPYAREMQSPFGNLRSPPLSSPYSSGSREPYTPHTPRFASPSDYSPDATSPPPLFADRPSSSLANGVLHQPARPEIKKAKSSSNLPPVPLSPVMSVDSDVSSNDKRSVKSGIGKLFGKNGSSTGSDKSLKEAKKSKDPSARYSSTSSSDSNVTLADPKAEAKRLKKEAAKARTERLAQDLADKAKRRAEEAKTAKANYVKQKSQRPWEESGGLYEGISYF
ncbi:hypothetical protein DICSQDRAFT_168321 [Dichomitus squalens LYAD-421 SS1]|uniref:uncharacterized protein n=1 Tax=Dichomitus squalens (strain LYAD-421) TaxID=732165 RepID=UPI000441146C|nr:uncharacterized protein DICSQDRAFT_168321 [Dichomitus squalens LYAD-421 SS1]EJF63432.1 hypothetical protein DICSQDRAFT_168321 [Dichomitus squalens LYAD-421 SS1]